MAYGTPNFNKMKDNPVCLQVNWDENEEFIHAWTEVNRRWVFFVFVLERVILE